MGVNGCDNTIRVEPRSKTNRFGGSKSGGGKGGEHFSDTTVHETLRPATSISAHRRQRSILPPRARTHVGRPPQHAGIQLTSTTHHETKSRSVEEV